MALQRTDKQLAWETEYLNKLQRFAEIDAMLDQTYTSFDESQGGQLYVPSSSNIAINRGTYALAEEIPLARIEGDKVIIPSGMNRKEYQKARKEYAQRTQGQGMKPISAEMYSWTSACSDPVRENMFAPDFHAILTMMYGKIIPLYEGSVTKIPLNSGYRWWIIDVDNDPHMGGMAVDIHASGDMRYKIADVCWMMGLRGVGVGRTFVHVDCSIDGGGWGYDPVPKYRGPGSPRG